MVCVSVYSSWTLLDMLKAEAGNVKGTCLGVPISPCLRSSQLWPVCVCTGCGGWRVLQPPLTWIDSTVLGYGASPMSVTMVAVMGVKGPSSVVRLPHGVRLSNQLP